MDSKCSVKSCNEPMAVEWPLLKIVLCSKHYDNPPDKYKKVKAESLQLSDAVLDSFGW